MNSITDIATVRVWLRDARAIAVLTGAGMSAESGVPTFRDAQTGLWAKFRPEELATEAAFRADPQLAEYQQRHPGRLTVITQNVDGLHQAAGSVGTLSLHGNIFDDIWLDPCAGAPGCGGVCEVSRAQPGRPPACADCGNLLRPGVVWFGEMLPAAALAAAEDAAQTCDLLLVVGTSGAVWPAAGLAHTARQGGARVVVVNPEPSELDGVAHALLRATAAAALPALLAD
jgi:NAD-dependent deacetylase